MEALLLKPANKKEADLLKSMIIKMNVEYSVISDEDKEDYALTKAILSAKKNKKPVSKETIMKKLMA